MKDPTDTTYVYGTDPYKRICSSCKHYDSVDTRCTVPLPWWAVGLHSIKHHRAPAECGAYEEEPLSLQEQTNGAC